MIFAHALAAQKIEINSEGSIQSEGFAGLDGNVDGFRLLANGLLEAVKAIFRDITIRGNSSFEGDIVSGPLELNNRNSATPDTITVHNQGTSTRAFSDWIDDRRLPIAANGTFGSIAFSWIDRRRTGPISSTCRLLNRDRNEVAAFEIGPDRGQNQSGAFPIFPQRLQIGFFNQQGRTFKLNNLPLNEPNLQGAIWQDSEGYLRIRR